MNKGVNLPALAARMLHGQRDEIDRCRICLHEAAPRAVGLDDEVRLDKPSTAEMVTVAEILVTVTRSEVKSDSVLPNTLCSSCAYSAVSSYKFIKQCEDSQKHWTNIHNAISESFATSEINNLTTSSLYVIIRRDDFNSVRKADIKNGGKRKKKDFKNELRSKKDRDLFQCTDCGKLFKNEYLLRKHTAVHLQDLKCPFCGKICGNKPRLNVHIARLHTVKNFKCTLCPKRFGSKYLVSEHQKSMHCHVRCKICGKTFTKKTTLRAHEDSHISWTCGVCGKSYKYKQTLKTHTCTDSIEKQYSCDECGKAYFAKNTLRTHILHDHGNNPYNCNVCDKTFFNRKRLVDHLAVHTGVKNYTCGLCKGKFMSQAILIRHTRVMHTGEKPFKCDKCEQVFVTSHRRLEHQRRNHDAPSPLCAVCGKKFTTFADLRKHTQKHMDPRSKLYCIVLDNSEE